MAGFARISVVSEVARGLPGCHQDHLVGLSSFSR